MKTTQYFCDKHKLVFNAIDTEAGFYISVILMKSMTEINYVKGENPAQLRLTSCLENPNYQDSNELEFTEAIGKADQILHKTPFL